MVASVRLEQARMAGRSVLFNSALLRGRIPLGVCCLSPNQVVKKLQPSGSTYQLTTWVWLTRWLWAVRCALQLMIQSPKTFTLFCAETKRSSSQGANVRSIFHFLFRDVPTDVFANQVYGGAISVTIGSYSMSQTGTGASIATSGDTLCRNSSVALENIYILNSTSQSSTSGKFSLFQTVFIFRFLLSLWFDALAFASQLEWPQLSGGSSSGAFVRALVSVQFTVCWPFCACVRWCEVDYHRGKCVEPEQLFRDVIINCGSHTCFGCFH